MSGLRPWISIASNETNLSIFFCNSTPSARYSLAHSPRERNPLFLILCIAKLLQKTWQVCGVLFVFIDPEANYSLYRKIWAKTRGVPFLYPHIRKCAIDGKDSLSEIFPLEILERGSRPRLSILNWENYGQLKQSFNEDMESEEADDRETPSYWPTWLKPVLYLLCPWSSFV